MSDGETEAPRPLLVELQVADEAVAWAAAGFSVDGAVVVLGPTTVRLLGRDPGADPASGAAERRRGIVGWTLAGVHLDDDHLDGLPTQVADAPVERANPSTPPPPAHPNGVIGLDHVVVLTPDLERTIAAIEAAGLGLRRIRETERNGTPMRQAFFRLGPVILEVVSGDLGSGAPADEAPATFFGLAVDADDLDATKALLGDGIGQPRPAVQAGRRIATFRHRALGMSVALAAMDHHGDR
jgi:catechol 2,3-dioxygenase-like lactoylglutathione lyase family enzyme